MKELAIPKSQGEAVFQFVMMSVVAFFVLVALFNLSRGEGLVVSLLWLALVTAALWTAGKEAGGWRRFLVNRLGDLLGRRFVESGPPEATEIRFGFQLAGRRFVQHRIALHKIKAVEWTTGQATHMAGRDMKDWTVWLWFDDDDPARVERKRKWLGRNAEQDLHGIGPSGRKDRTEALGLTVVDFLRDAGADLVADSTAPACFLRRGDPHPFNPQRLPA